MEYTTKDTQTYKRTLSFFAYAFLSQLSCLIIGEILNIELDSIFFLAYTPLIILIQHTISGLANMLDNMFRSGYSEEEYTNTPTKFISLGMTFEKSTSKGGFIWGLVAPIWPIILVIEVFYRILKKS
jgi:hypothetical protein